MRPDEIEVAFAALASAEPTLGGYRARQVDCPVATFLAVDELGGRHLLVELEGGKPLEEDTASSGVVVVRRTLRSEPEDADWVDLALRLENLTELFSVIVSEVVAELSRGMSPSVAPTIALDRWRELLDSSGRTISLARHVGVFGELWQLREVVRRGDARTEVWAGPLRGRHDLQGAAGHDIEVKTSRGQNVRIVTIHGIGQLEAGGCKSLYLACMRVEPVNAAGETLADLLRTLVALGCRRTDLQERLNSVGFTQDVVGNLAQAFRVTENRLYAVNDDFPRLRLASLPPPPEVTRIDYDLDLTAEPPTPLSSAQSDDVYAMVGTKP